ncbi:hypothetical protein HYPSUDRAFT_209585 [Hypholoma sublateritium FD-334 SS-4]|uniref:Uncharacterized protein n=1 Tax=Hypholoma sublateritium (strain FD-334 SS-4) TaxID=945553 RepID=A0A0D2NY27_HYPSF|nr:hypothetical protein HYPSUDRAFT_209585 [Hypholoma sublateritium FD-334 SS-4]
MSDIDQTPETNINRIGQTGTGDQWTFLAPRHRHQQRDARGRFIPATVTPPRTESPALTNSSSFLSSLSSLTHQYATDSLSQPPTPFNTSPHSTHFEHPPPPPPAYTQWPGDPSQSAHSSDDPSHSTHNPGELEESPFVPDMSNSQIQPFHSDGENNENPQDFLKSINYNVLKSDSPAEDWFMGLPSTSTDTWAHLVNAFNSKWPSKAAVPKSRAE